MEEFAKETFDRLKDKMKSAWDLLSDDQKDALKEATQDLAKLTMKEIRGEDVDEDMAIVKATLKNFEVAGIMRARSALLETIEEVAGEIGVIARRLILGR